MKLSSLGYSKQKEDMRMLEKIDLSVKVKKEKYKEAMEEMEAKLGLLQRQCKEAGIPVMILF